MNPTDVPATEAADRERVILAQASIEDLYAELERRGLDREAVDDLCERMALIGRDSEVTS